MTHLNYPFGYAQLAQSLQGFGAFRKRWAWFFGLAWFVILGPGSLLALIVTDWLFPLPWWLLLSLFPVAAGLTIFSVIAYALRPLLKRIDVEHEALVIESLHGLLDNQVIGSLQLGREVVEAQASGKPVGYSVAIASALVNRTADNIEQLYLPALVDRTKAYWVLSFAAGIILGGAALASLRPEVFSQFVARIGDAYTTMMDRLFPVNIVAASEHMGVLQTPVTMGLSFPVPVVSSGDVSVIQGSAVKLGVQISNARRSDVLLILTNLKTKLVTTQHLTLGPDHRIILEPYPDPKPGDPNPGDLKPGVQESFSYEFENSGRRSPPHKVLVGDIPAIAAMNTELTYPEYTGMSTRTLVGRIPRIQALQGTEALVSIASTIDLDPERSYVVFSGGEKQELMVSGRFAHFSFHIDREEDVAIHLTGALGPGFEMREPATFKVVPQIDRPPRVSLLLSQKTKALGATADGLPIFAEESLHFSLSALAEDDFGIDEMSLEYKIDTKNVHLEGLPKRNPADGAVDFKFFDPSKGRVRPPRDREKFTFTEIFKNLSPALVPGERVTLAVWAKDNNPSPGSATAANPRPGWGKSESFTFTVVRPDLGAYVEQQFAFGSDPLLGGLRRVQRATNLLIEAERTTHTEAKGIVEKQEVKSRVGAENWPGGSQDAVGDYFRLLSGEK